MLVYKKYPTTEMIEQLDILKGKNKSIAFVDTDNEQSAYATPSLVILARYWSTVKSIVRSRLANNLSTYVMLDDCMACYNKIILVTDWNDIITFDDSLKEYFIDLELDNLGQGVKTLVLENDLLVDKLNQYNNFPEFLDAIEYELEVLQDKEENELYDIDIDISTQKLTYLKPNGYKHEGKGTHYIDEGQYIFHSESRTKEVYQATCYDIMLAWLQVQWYQLLNIEPMKREPLQAILD